jgi:hypothetical protein
MIQQGVSVGGLGNTPSNSHDPEGGGMTIGKVMDWIEARLEAIKSREEEEEEEEEKEKERERQTPAPPITTSGPEVVKPPAPANVTPSSNPVPRCKDQVRLSRISAHRFSDVSVICQVASNIPAPNSANSYNNRASQPPSPSPPPPIALRPIYPPNPQRSKSRLGPSDPKHPDRSYSHPSSLAALTLPPIRTDLTFSDTVPLVPTLNLNPSAYPIPIDLAAGVKRRHAMMAMQDSTLSAVSLTGSSPGGTSHSHFPLPPSGNVSAIHVTGSGGIRRRVRSTRGLVQHHQSVTVSPSTEAMDVEEDGGRERKRVTRR